MSSTKLLIVDDEKQYTDRFADYVKETGIEVLVANNASAAITLASRNMPEIGTIDFQIGITTGNEVAKVLKSINPSIKLAGITSGDPRNFDETLFDIRENKNIDEKIYQKIVECLRSSTNPCRDYSAYKIRSLSQNENIVALYILVQGYTAARNLQKGLQPVPGITLPVPSEKNIATLLDLSKVGIDSKNLYNTISADPLLKDDKIIREFFQAIDEKKFGEIPLKNAQYIESKLKTILEGAK